jgi:adenylate kinase
MDAAACGRGDPKVLRMKLILIGAQGSGKGTQAARLSEKYDIPHISTGDMFRAAADAGTPLGKAAKKHWEQGKLVPENITIGLVKERLAEPDCEGGWILDGFPRTLRQAEALDEFAQPDLVIELKVPDDIAIKRISERKVCRKCKAVYGLATTAAEQCLECGGELVQRDDDKPEAVQKRLQIYHEETEPLREYYKPRGIVKEVDGTRNPDEVFAELCSLIGE